MNKEITWNIINSLLAGALVLFGAFSTGKITWESIIIAFGASGLVAITQFRDFWNTKKPKPCKKIFSFINF